MQTITLFTLLFITINCGRTVYMCHDDPFKDEQCMKTEKLGSNTFYWVRKCKGAKVCVDLPYYGGIIGACSIKVRTHYDGESCANGNKCGSGICDGTKCKGLNPGLHCEVGLGQCKKGYLCRSTADDNGDATGNFTCQPPLADGAKCSGFSYSLLDSSDFTIYDSRLFDPAFNPCGQKHVCSRKASSSPTCVEIASIDNDVAATNPLACKSGYLDNSNICKDGPNSATHLTLKTAKGAVFNYYKNITDHFKAWKEEWDKKNIKDDDFIYEAYRYTKNKKKINEAFFKYTHSGWIADADECAYDYLWKQESASSLKFSLMILILALLF